MRIILRAALPQLLPAPSISAIADPLDAYWQVLRTDAPCAWPATFVDSARRRLSPPHNPGIESGGLEIASVAWAWAASKHLDLDSSVVFHDSGYRGGIMETL